MWRDLTAKAREGNGILGLEDWASIRSYIYPNFPKEGEEN